MSAARKIMKLYEPLTMRRGGVLHGAQVAYETWGELSLAADNAVLIFTGLSPDAHAASSPANPAPGWWEEMVGPGKPIDSDRFYVICVNSLGSCFGSTGPLSINPASGRPYGPDFPTLSVEDIAAAARAALLQMGIPRLRAVVGPSLGGMSALAYALQFPDAVDNMLNISSAVHALPFAIAVRSLQRELIRSDPAWRDGRYEPGKGPIQGMRLARKLGMISYRSAAEWRQRFGRARAADDAPGRGGPYGVEFAIEAYLEVHAQRFVGGFDANCYLQLSRAMDLFDAAEHGETLEAAFAKLRLKRALVIGVETDFLFPPDQQEQLARLLDRGAREVEFVRLPSLQGHDSFLIDIERFGPVVRNFMSRL
ncbi:MAG TPA: homoserine O-acetyltransferase [Gammaproteobacteria bacterium]|nr:homoserine O-acetyltransferase [Gammaproteobacteria bacterium]